MLVYWNYKEGTNTLSEWRLQGNVTSYKKMYKLSFIRAPISDD